MYFPNLKSVALPVPEIIGCTQKFGQSLDTSTLPFLQVVFLSFFLLSTPSEFDWKDILAGLPAWIRQLQLIRFPRHSYHFDLIAFDTCVEQYCATVVESLCKRTQCYA